MLANYFKTALRHFWRQKSYAFINVLGLTIGLACSFFILLWVQDELRYDRFHEQGDQLHRVMRNASFSNGQIFTWSAIPKPLAEKLETDYPEITHAMLMTWNQRMLIAKDEKVFREEGIHAGRALFDMFTFPFIQGDPVTALDDPGSIVLSERLAAKYFGTGWRSEDVIGQAVRVENRADFTVAGVFENVPSNSSLSFDFVIPIEEYIQRNDWVEHWGNNGLRLYVRLDAAADPQEVSGKIANVINEQHPSANSEIFLQALPDVRLHSDFKDGKLAGGRILIVRIFGIVAVFILLIASINFMNLATARSARRAREIGVRKAVGATQHSLIRQFLGESVLLAMAAFALALVLVAVGIPAFNSITGKSLTLGHLDPFTLQVFFGISLLTGLLAGAYPALYLSSFSVIGVLRSQQQHRSGGAVLRKGLVVFQFALSILLIVGTMTIYRQMEFIRTKNLGLDRENVISMVREGGARDQYDAFKQELLQRPGIASVSVSSQNPLSVGSSTTDPEWDGKDPDTQVLFHIINGDEDFVQTMKMDLVAGRPFSADLRTDSANFIVNERAVQAMGMDDPVGQRLAMWGREGQIIGVVRDFHMTSLYAQIEPTIIRLAPEDTWMLFVRTQPGRTVDALGGLEEVVRAFSPGYPFEYRFLDESFEEMYRSEMAVGRLTNIFSFIAIVIACLGLFGLASFTAEQRTKEIGIRKVMGASVGGLVMLLSRDFVKLVLGAFVLTAPAAYFLMDKWLSNFAYRTEMGVGVFLVAGVASLLIAWLTVSYQSVRAAMLNPVKTLRTE